MLSTGIRPENRIPSSANNYGFGLVDDTSPERLVAYRKHLEGILANHSCEATDQKSHDGKRDDVCNEVVALRIQVQSQQADTRAAVELITQARAFLAGFGGRKRLAAWRTSVASLLQKLGAEEIQQPPCNR